MATKTRYTIFDIKWAKNEDSSFVRSRKITRYEADLLEADGLNDEPGFSYYELEVTEGRDETATKVAIEKALNKFTGFKTTKFSYFLGWE
jgi:hypothetical protein